MLAKTGINAQVNITKIMNELKEKYKSIYVFQFEDEIFIYHTIGRRKYKELVQNDAFDAQDKEEQLCAACVVYPENYDWANCPEAGIPTRLAEEIIENSYLKLEQRDSITRYYRNEMNDTDNQVNCIIQAAFPTLKLEEIEDFDVVTAAKYLSRAEWILHNISGVQFRELTEEEMNYGSVPEKSNVPEIHHTEELTSEGTHTLKSTPKSENQIDTIKPETTAAETKKFRTKEDIFNHRGKKKEPMTPEKLAEMKRKYPEIPWDEDMVSRFGISGITEQKEISDVPAALQPRHKR